MKLEPGTMAWGTFEDGVRHIEIFDSDDHVVKAFEADRPTQVLKLCRHYVFPTKELALQQYSLYLESCIADARQEIERQQKRIDSIEKDLRAVRRELSLRTCN